MGYLKKVGTAVIYIGLFLAVITFLPGLPPDAEFSAYSIVPPGELDPKLELKNRLNNAERLYIGEAIGAESFASYNGKLYSTVVGGYVVRLEEGRVVPIVKLGEKCDGIWQEEKCGRPLGLEFDKTGNLYVMDAYYGIFKVNMATKEYKNIVNSSEPIEGKPPQIPNSLDIAKNGDIYWSDSSTDFHLQDGMHTFLANPSGRLIRYNAATRKNEVLVRKLGFANGVKLSNDESFVIVAESSTARIMKYNLKGPKAGQHEIFIEGLPGTPDNIHSDGHGGFLVTLIFHIDSNHPQISSSLIPHPYIRKMFSRLLTLIEAPFKLLQDIYPNTYAERLAHSIGSFQSMLFLDSSQKSLILRIDASGNVIEALVSDDNNVFCKSSAYIHNDYLWLGTPFLNYVTRVPLKQAFPDLVSSREQSSHIVNKDQPPKATASDTQSKKVKRDTDTTTAKASKLKPEKTASPSTPKPTTTPTPKPSSTPTTTPKPAVPKTTPRPTATPKASTVPETNNKHTSTDSNVKPSETKPILKANAEIKKDGAKTETNQGIKEDTTKTSTKSGKSARENQDTPTKQKAQKSKPEKVEGVETSRPKDTNKK